jgi:hypothetical protein
MTVTDLTVKTDPMLFTWRKEWGWKCISWTETHKCNNTINNISDIFFPKTHSFQVYNYHHHYQFPAYTI